MQKTTERVGKLNQYVGLGLKISSVAFFFGMVLSSVTAYQLKPSKSHTAIATLGYESNVVVARDLATSAAVFQGLMFMGLALAVVVYGVSLRGAECNAAKSRM